MAAGIKINPALPLVKRIKETDDMAEVVELLQSGLWVAIWAGQCIKDGGTSYKFVLGKTM